METIFNPRDINIKMGKKGKTSWVGSKLNRLLKEFKRNAEQEKVKWIDKIKI